MASSSSSSFSSSLVKKPSNHSVFLSSRHLPFPSLSIRAASTQKRSFGSWVLKRTSYSPCLAQRRNKSYGVLSRKKDFIEERLLDSSKESEIEAGWICSSTGDNCIASEEETGIEGILKKDLYEEGWIDLYGDNSKATDETVTEAEWTDLTTGQKSETSEEIGSEAERSNSTTGEIYETNEEETGTEGILNKLEEEWKESFELSSGGKQRNDKQDDLQLSLEVRSAKRSTTSVSRSSNTDLLDDFDESLSMKPDTWKTFSSKREASERIFEAAGDIGEYITTDDEMVAEATKTDLKFGDNEKDQTSISSRLDHLQSELASLRLELTSPDYQLLSDQRKKALRLLQTTYIAFPKFSASEVFLIGSFDGWTNQKRMERSNSGVFSLNLMLHPGRYEIKFIVDGKWMTDPLRPVANPGPYQNNLLIVSES